LHMLMNCGVSWTQVSSGFPWSDFLAEHALSENHFDLGSSEHNFESGRESTHTPYSVRTPEILQSSDWWWDCLSTGKDVFQVSSQTGAWSGDHVLARASSESGEYSSQHLIIWMVLTEFFFLDFHSNGRVSRTWNIGRVTWRSRCCALLSLLDMIFHQHVDECRFK
jgi:hypothetical protein